MQNIIPDVIEQIGEFEHRYKVQIPVIAAGGIYSGADIYDIMAQGASGVQMGTRFVVTEECDAAPAFKDMYIHANKEDIEIIQSPVGMPGRAIQSPFLQRVCTGITVPRHCPYHCIKTCNMVDSPYCIMMALFNAYKGDFNHGFAFAGSNAWRTNRIMSVKDLLAELHADYLLRKKEREYSFCAK